MTRRTRLLPFLTYPIHFCISFEFFLPPSLPPYLPVQCPTKLLPQVQSTGEGGGMQHILPAERGGVS